MSEPIAADWSAADLHAHTRASDGMDSAETMLAAAVAAGLDCTAITEHDQIDGALRAQSIAIERGLPIAVIVGSEVTSRQGHMVALWLTEPVRRSARPPRPSRRSGGRGRGDHRPPRVDRPAQPRVKEIDQLVRDLAPAQRDSPELVLAIELANPSLTARLRVPAVALANAERWRLPEAGGSDAHFASHVGAAVTRYPGSGPDALRAAFIAGQTRAETREHPSLLSVGPRLLLQPVLGLSATPRALTRRFIRRVGGR